MKPIGWIYLTTNLANGKIYIGQHVISSDKRANATYIGSGIKIKRALNKYGKENFKRKILKLCYTQKELNTWEYVYIKKYKSQDKNIGYNIADGDILSSNCNPAKLPEVRKKMSESRKGRFAGKNHWNYGKHRTDEVKEKLRKAHIGFRHSEESKRKMSENNAKNNLGKHLSEETRRKISESRIGKYAGKNNPNYGNHKLAGKNNPMYGTRYLWINNGVKNKRHNIGEEIPNGWNIGFIRH